MLDNARQGTLATRPSIPLVSGGKMAPMLILGLGPSLASASLRTCAPASSRAVCAWYDGASTRGMSVRRSIPIRDDIAKPHDWVLRVKIPSFARAAGTRENCGRNIHSSFQQVPTRKLYESFVVTSHRAVCVTSFKSRFARTYVSNQRKQRLFDKI